MDALDHCLTVLEYLNGFQQLGKIDMESANLRRHQLVQQRAEQGGECDVLALVLVESRIDGFKHRNNLTLLSQGGNQHWKLLQFRGVDAGKIGCLVGN